MSYLVLLALLGHASSLTVGYVNFTSGSHNVSSQDNGTDFNTYLPGWSPLPLVSQMFQAMLQIYSPAYPSSPACALQRNAVFMGSQLNQIWALQFLDSMGKPSSGILQGDSRFMGNFDQCMSINSGKVKDGPITGMFVKYKFELKMSMSLPSSQLGLMNQESGLPNIFWYVCLPSACTQGDAQDIGRKLAGNVGGVELKETYLYLPKSPTEDTCFIVAVVVFSVLGLCCLIGTVLELFKDEVTSRDPQTAKPSTMTTANLDSLKTPDVDGVDVTSRQPVANGVKVLLDRVAVGQRDLVGHRASLAEVVGRRSVEQERSRSIDNLSQRQESLEQDAQRRESQGVYRRESQGLTAYSRDSPDLNALRRESQELMALRRESNLPGGLRRESQTLANYRRESLMQGVTATRDSSGRDSLGRETSQIDPAQPQDVEKSGNDTASQHVVPRKIGFVSRFFLAFSLTSNLKDILKAKNAPGDIACLHGIRVISISWVILGHTYFMAPQFGNTLTFVDMTKWWTIHAIINGTFSVDTFFLLSGCLVSFLFLREVNKTGGLKATQVIMYYTHRLLRLTPLYALSILLYTGIMPYLETGPFAGQNHDRDVVCRDVWWWNLLYISNFRNDGYFCLQWSWYLPNDMQFYFLAPLVLIPIALGYQYLGLLVALLQLACHLVTFTVLEEKYNSSLFRNPGHYFANIYIKPWTRVGPYALGLILGFMLFKTRTKVRLHKILVTFGWMLSIGGALTLVYVTYDYMKQGLTTLSWGDSSVNAYEILRSPMWGICVGWVIFACASGYGGFINSFLSWQAWIPLSRLTFGTYLTHLMVIMYFNGNEKTVSHFSYHSIIQRYLTAFVVSYALSLVLSLLIETPVRNLTKPSAKRRTPGKPTPDTTPGPPQSGPHGSDQPDQRQPGTPRPRVHPIHRLEGVADGDVVDTGKNFELKTLNVPKPTSRGVYNRGFLSDNPYDDISSPEHHPASYRRWQV